MPKSIQPDEFFTLSAVMLPGWHDGKFSIICTPIGVLSFDNHLNQYHMEKFITRDRLTEFVEKMWNSGYKLELKPADNSMTVWSENYSKLTYVNVVSDQAFEPVIEEVIAEVKEG